MLNAMTIMQFKNPREHNAFAKKLRASAPLVERLLWNALREMKEQTGLKFRRQHPLHPYIVDFACVKARLIVEFDGPSHDVRRAYDVKREADICKRGWTIVRFTNDDVRKNLEGVVLAITKKAEELLILHLP